MGAGELVRRVVEDIVHIPRFTAGDAKQIHVHTLLMHGGVDALVSGKGH
jgi:hypothetical protein